MVNQLRKMLLKLPKSELKRGDTRVDSMRTCFFCGKTLSSFNPKKGKVVTRVGHYCVKVGTHEFTFCKNYNQCRKKAEK